MRPLEAAKVVVLRVLEREERARLDEIAWTTLRVQLYPTVALELLRGQLK